MLGEIKRKHSGNKPTVWIEKVTGNKVTHNKNNLYSTTMYVMVKMSVQKIFRQSITYYIYTCFSVCL